MAPALALGLKLGLPALIKLAEKVIPGGKKGAEKKALVVNSQGAIIDQIAKVSGQSPQEIAPWIGTIIDIVHGVMEDQGVLGEDKKPPATPTDPFDGDEVIFKGILTRV